MAIRFSKAADTDLLNILEHSVAQFGQAKSESYMSQLDRSLQALSENPEIARLRREITPPVRIHPSQQHLIVYTVQDDGETVLILRVRHHSEDWARVP